MSSTIDDQEFGQIKISRRARTRQIAVRLATSGGLVVSAGKLVPKSYLKAFVNSARPQIRRILDQQKRQRSYDSEQPIGKLHYLSFQRTDGASRVQTEGYKIVVSVPDGSSRTDSELTRLIKEQVIKALRKEARDYMTKRLEIISSEQGLPYGKLRFMHASTRWGSCSSAGNISLNIALMNLSLSLIDYVIIHELCHTVEMNHSKAFWDRVGLIDPKYKQHRQDLKKHSPHI